MSLASQMISAGVQSHRAAATNGSVAIGLTGAGTNQATGLLLGSAINVFGTVAASTAARLPVATLADSITVRNGGANALLLFPAVGGQINAVTVDASLSLAAGANVTLTCVSVDGLKWIAIVSA